MKINWPNYYLFREPTIKSRLWGKLSLIEAWRNESSSSYIKIHPTYSISVAIYRMVWSTIKFIQDQRKLVWEFNLVMRLNKEILSTEKSLVKTCWEMTTKWRNFILISPRSSNKCRYSTVSLALSLFTFQSFHLLLLSNCRRWLS